MRVFYFLVFPYKFCRKIIYKRIFRETRRITIYFLSKPFFFNPNTQTLSSDDFYTTWLVAIATGISSHRKIFGSNALGVQFNLVSLKSKSVLVNLNMHSEVISKHSNELSMRFHLSYLMWSNISLLLFQVTRPSFQQKPSETRQWIKSLQSWDMLVILKRKRGTFTGLILLQCTQCNIQRLLLYELTHKSYM